MGTLFRFFHQEEIHFSAAHRYAQVDWSDEKNASVFGACFNPDGHGHDYRLVVEIKLPENSATKGHSELLLKAMWALHENLDHQHLNFAIPAFQTGSLVPTTENIALFCLEQIKKAAPTLTIHKVQLFERSDLWSEIIDRPE